MAYKRRAGVRALMTCDGFGHFMCCEISKAFSKCPTLHAHAVGAPPVEHSTAYGMWMWAQVIQFAFGTTIFAYSISELDTVEDYASKTYYWYSFFVLIFSLATQAITFALNNTPWCNKSIALYYVYSVMTAFGKVALVSLATTFLVLQDVVSNEAMACGGTVIALVVVIMVIENVQKDVMFGQAHLLDVSTAWGYDVEHMAAFAEAYTRVARGEQEMLLANTVRQRYGLTLQELCDGPPPTSSEDTVARYTQAATDVKAQINEWHST